MNLDLSKFLDRFKKIESSQQELNNKIKEIVFEKSGYELKDKEFKIHNGTLYLNVSGIARSAIYIKRISILASLSSSLGSTAPKEII